MVFFEAAVWCGFELLSRLMSPTHVVLAAPALYAVESARSSSIGVVARVQDADISIRRRALDLIYALVTKNNVRALVKELLNYLALTSGDVEFKADLTDKVMRSCPPSLTRES